MSQTLSLTIQGSPAWQGSPPQDELHEFTPVEWGRRMFCYEQNRTVQAELCGARFTFAFDPDLSSLLDYLPEQIQQLAQGEPLWTPFPERGWEIKFYPDDAETRCVVREYGYRNSETECTLPTAEVIATLSGFVVELAQRMVAGGYLTQAQADEYLAPLRP